MEGPRSNTGVRPAAWDPVRQHGGAERSKRGELCGHVLGGEGVVRAEVSSAGKRVTTQPCACAEVRDSMCVRD